MRLRVLNEPGELAQHPEAALDALADIAAADGADREDWLVKALRSAGASHRLLPVDHDYRFLFQQEMAEEAAADHRRMVAAQRRAIVERLEERTASIAAEMAEEARRALEG